MVARVPATMANQSIFQAIISRNPTCHPDARIDARLLIPIGADRLLRVQQAGALLRGMEDLVRQRRQL